MIRLVRKEWLSIPTRPLKPALVMAEPNPRAPEMLTENPILIVEVVNDLGLLPAELPTTEISANETDDKSAA